MTMVGRLLRWLLKPWPLWAVALLGIVHYEVNSFFNPYEDSINKVTSAAVQIAGGLLVLYSLNQNIGTFRRGSLFSVIAQWYRDFPLIRRNIELRAESIGTSAVLGTPALIVTRSYETIEERLKEIERRIDENLQLLIKKEEKLYERIGQIETDLRNETHRTSSEIAKVKQVLDDTLVGDISIQVFGVLLVLYGAVLSFL